MKKHLKKIGKPVMDKLFDFLMRQSRSHRGRVLYDAAELKLLREALLTQNLFALDGYMVSSFEKEFAAMYGAPYAVASTSGTAAIHTALGALDLDGGSEIITAPVTDLGTIIPILYQNCIPVFADIDQSCQMDPADVERKITPQTKAIIAVHLFGNACDMEKMAEVARRHKLPLIEDCSQAHWTFYRGKPVGVWGDIGCFSFQQSKHMTTGDGGMTITSNKEYADRMKLFVDKGYARKGWGSRAYLFHAPNYRMNELTGAVGRAQLQKVKAVVEKRRAMGSALTERLKNIPSIQPVAPTEGCEHSYWLFPFVLKGVDVSTFCKKMIQKGVYAMQGYTGKPIYLCTESLTAKKTYGKSELPFTARNVTKTYEYKEGLCPKAEKALETLVTVPWNESWGMAGVEKAERVIRECLKEMGVSSGLSAAMNGSSAPTPAIAVKSAQKTVAVAIVGCGQIGQSHLNAYLKNPEVKIVAVADTDLGRAQNFSAQCNARAYGSHQELLRNEKIAAVSICTVPSTHEALTLDFLNAGVHVLCEKPLAMDVAQAEAMLKKADEKGLLLLTAFKLRFFREVQKAKELLSQGTLGKIVNVRILFGGYMDMAGTWFVKKEISGGGIIMDNGPHVADLVAYLFGPVTSVSARAWDATKVGVEDTAKLDFSVAGGFPVTADISWAAWVTPKHYMEIYGSEGTLYLDTEGVTLKYKTWNDWKRIPNEESAEAGFSRQIDHFIRGTQSGSTPVIDAKAGLEAQRLLAAAYRSIEKVG